MRRMLVYNDVYFLINFFFILCVCAHGYVRVKCLLGSSLIWVISGSDLDEVSAFEMSFFEMSLK